MKASIPAQSGEPYTVQTCGKHLVRVIRKSDTGRRHVIVFSRADAIAVTNKLIDLLEQDNP